MGEGMTEAQLDALTQQTVGMAYLFVGLAGLLLYLAHLGPDGLRRWERLRDHFFTVKGSLGPAADYVDGDEADRDPDALTSAASRQEVEAEAAGGRGAEARTPALVITEKALQSRLKDAEAEGYDRGAVALYAFLAQRGYLVPGKATAIKADFFKVAGGRRLQALNAAIDAEPPAPPEAPAPEPPAEVKPISGAPRPPGVVYAGEVAED